MAAAGKRLAKAQRAMARKQKGSVNRRRARQRVARIHARVARLRENHLHHVSRALVDRFQVIGLEDLNARGLARTRLALSVHDAGWGVLRRRIACKAAWAGRFIILYPRFARSSGTCPDCGHVEPRLELKVRHWICGACGVHHDRDVAAERVIE